MKQLFPILFCLLPFLPVSGQEPYFREMQIDKEFHNLKVLSCYYTADGYVLIGTAQGAYIHDGKTFTSLTADTSFRKPVTAIYKTGGGEIWLGFRTGKIATIKDRKIKWFEPEEGTPATEITALCTDNKQQVWIGTAGEGIYSWNGSRLYNFNTDDGLSDNYIHCFATATDGVIYAGTDNGITTVMLEGQTKTILNITQAGLDDPIILSLAFDSKGVLYAGSQDKGLYIFEGNTFAHPLAFRDISGMSIHAVLPFSRGLLLATSPHGLIEFSMEEPDHWHLLRPGNITIACSDYSGNNWFSSQANRWTYFFQYLHFLPSYEEQSLSDISAIDAERSTIWFANSSGVFSLEFKNSGRHMLKRWLEGKDEFSRGIISIEADGKYIWLGSFGFGLGILDTATGKISLHTEASGLINNNILGMDHSPEGIWLATLGGVARCSWNGSEFSQTEFQEEDGLGTNFIYDTWYDGESTTWFATDGKGITAFSQNRFRNYHKAQSIPSKIYSITGTRGKALWLNSAEQGLFSFYKGELLHYSVQEGLRELNNTQIATYLDKWLVVGHNNGIDIFDLEHRNWVYFSENAGLGEYVPALNAIVSDESGRIWMGSNKGLVLLHPFDTLFKAYPRVNLQYAEILGSNELFPENHILQPNQNYLVFHYDGLWYPDPDKVLFQVKLEGIDKDWILTRNNSITYSNLPPGKYTLMIRASTGPNFEGAEAIRFEFQILAPLWKRWWFIMGIAILLSILVYIGFRLRIRQLKNRENLKKENIRFQFENLKNQVNPHFLFNSFNTLIHMIESEKELAIEYVEKLSEFFRAILTYREKNLIPLSEELKLLHNYLYLQQKRFGSSLIFQLAFPENTEMYFIPPLTLQLLAENAIKHNIISSGSPLIINFRQEENYLVVENSLNRKKFKEPSTGLGLENIKKKYELLGKYAVIIEEDSKNFRVKLPVIINETA